jgi:hypothetical protein
MNRARGSNGCMMGWAGENCDRCADGYAGLKCQTKMEYISQLPDAVDTGRTPQLGKMSASLVDKMAAIRAKHFAAEAETKLEAEAKASAHTAELAKSLEQLKAARAEGTHLGSTATSPPAGGDDQSSATASRHTVHLPSAPTAADEPSFQSERSRAS